MTDQNVREELLSIWEEIKASGPEGLLEMADDLISKNSQCADVFIEKFISEINPIYKELLAQMILYGVHYEPAIEFLKNDRGWDDFTGYAGFPES
jgi:hypothetical protein